MTTTNITPSFKNADERNIVAGTIGLSLILGLTGFLALIPPLVVYFGMNDKLSNCGKDIVRAFANFEILLSIIAVILTITLVGSILIPLVLVYGLIYGILALLAVLNNTEVKIPIFFEFIKESSEIINPTTNNENTKDETKP